MSINVANNNPHVVYTVAEGATQTTFSITFEFFDDDEVQLYVDGIIKTQGSGDGNYTITGGEGSTGTATFNTVSSGIQPVTGITGGSQVVITRNIPIERVTDFSAGSDINRAALNTQLDTLTAIAADNKMRSVRALTAPITDPTDVGTSLVIPKAADRANGFLSFDSNGNAAINSVVDLSFLTLERLDIDNVRIDGNTVSSTTGSLILAPTADVEINIPASSSLYMQRAGTTALDFAFTSVSQEIRFINTTTATTYSVIQSNHLGGTSSDLILKSDGGPLELDTGGGTIPLKDDGVQRGYLNINTANTIKLYTGTGTGTLNTTFDGADVTIAGELVVSGNLTVDGTTTTINSTTLTVDDKNIVLASGATTSLAADGAGITIDGASASLTYVDLTGAMTFNKDVDIGDNDIENAQKLHFTENVSLYPSDGDDSILNLQAEDVGSAQLRFITGTGSGVFRGGVVASQNNVFGLKDSNEQTFIKSQDGNLPTQIFHTYDSPSAGSSLRIEAGSNFVKLYGSEGVEAQKYKDADDTSYYLEPAGTSVLATVGATQLNVDNITIDGNTISSTNTDGNINLRCNGNGVVDVDSELFVYGNAINGTSAYVQIGNTDTGGDDVRIQGPNPNFSLYDSTAVADGVAAYTGGVNFYGQKTNTAYHKYSTIRPRIINGLDSDTARTGALHFGVSDGASAAATNIIFKIEPDGIEVAGNITSTNDPLKISATTTSSSANIILEGDASPILSLRASGSNDDKISFKSDGAFQYINTNDQLTIQTGTNDALFLFGSSDIRTDSLGGTHTISSRAGDISFITGTIGSTTERMRIAGAGGISVSADMSFGDNNKAIFGAELEIYSDATHARIREYGSGQLKIQGDNMQLLTSDGASTYLEGNASTSAVTLYHASNSPRLATTSTGIDVTGNATFADNGKAVFGAGSDLQIYHDGSRSIIQDNGTGNLRIQANNLELNNADNSENYLFAANNGAVTLYYDNAEKLNTTSTGVDITGTLTSDGLTVDGDVNMSDSTPVFTMTDTDGGSANMAVYTGNLVISADSANEYSNKVLQLGVGDKSYFNLADNGDISFREDTGTTAKFFWDASAESLGIGTSSPSRLAELYGTSNPALRINNGTDIADIGLASSAGALATSSTSGALVLARSGANDINFATNGTNRMTIDSSGRVGIGGVPNTNWRNDVADQEVLMLGAEATFFSDSGVTTELWNNAYVDNSDVFKNISTRGASRYFQYQGAHKWFTAASASAGSNIGTEINSTPKMTLDVSGNLLVGKTTTAQNTAGTLISATNGVRASVDSNVAALLNRLTLDGEIVSFRKDGIPVGSIGAKSGDIYIGTGDTGIRFNDGDNAVYAADTTTGGASDGNISLGVSGARFKDLYLSGAIHLGGTAPANRKLYSQSANYPQQNYMTSSSVNYPTLQLRTAYATGGQTATQIDFRNGADTAVGTITSTVSSTAYNTSSDYRLKENVVDLTGATDRIKQIPVHRFNFIADPDKTVDGFLAHEVQEIVPEAITGAKDAMRNEEYEVTPAVLDDDGNVVTEAVMGTRSVPDYQGIDQSKLVPLLVATIRELEARITALENA